MAVRPLRPATDRCFGGLLPHQPANRTRVHPVPDCSFPVRVMRLRRLTRSYQPFPAAIPQYRAGCPRVTHPSATKQIQNPSEDLIRTAPFDLHVLGTPPAFILSQDRTLYKIFDSDRYTVRIRIQYPVQNLLAY